MTKEIDPYKVLGVSKSASVDDIEKAYKRLCLKYHPDSNINNPNAEYARQEFVKLQEAYYKINKHRIDGFSHGNYGNVFGDFKVSESEYLSIKDVSTVTHLKAAENLIRHRYYDQAISLMEVMDKRPALWYYLMAHAYLGEGNKSEASEYARMAYEFEPENMNYMHFLTAINKENTGEVNGQEAVELPSGSRILSSAIVFLIFMIIVIIVMTRIM